MDDEDGLMDGWMGGWMGVGGWLQRQSLFLSLCGCPTLCLKQHPRKHMKVLESTSATQTAQGPAPAAQDPPALAMRPQRQVAGTS